MRMRFCLQDIRPGPNFPLRLPRFLNKSDVLGFLKRNEKLGLIGYVLPICFCIPIVLQYDFIILSFTNNSDHRHYSVV